MTNDQKMLTVAAAEIKLLKATVVDCKAALEMCRERDTIRQTTHSFWHGRNSIGNRILYQAEKALAPHPELENILPKGTT